MSGETHNVSRTIEVSIAHVGLDGGVARSITVAFGQLAAQPYWDNIRNKPTFAAVATSGSYNDLTDQPTVLADVRYNSKGRTLQKSADGTEYINIITLSDLKHDMDLDNVTNDAQVKASEKGAALGVATLDSNGYIEQSQLPLDEPYGLPTLDENGHIRQNELQLKTINNRSIKGVGNITIQEGGSADAVLYTKQTLTTEQQTTARENIGAGTSDFSGSYNDLTDQPTIPTVPEISTDISSDATSDTKTASPKAVYDEVHPAFGSSQPAGGMLPNVLYKLGTLSGSVTIALATPADANIENEYRFTFTADSTAPTITWPNSITKWIGNSINNGAPNVEASTYYEVSIEDGYGIFNAF